MKFEEILAGSLAPEWKTQYLVYKELKKMIYCYEKSLRDKQTTIYDDNLLTAENEFFELINSELDKINDFYTEKLAEARRKHGELIRELRVLKRLATEYNDNRNTKYTHSQKNVCVINKELDGPIEFIQPGMKINHRKRLKSLGYFFTEFYLSVVILLNYQQLNYTGYRKILKKHDKEWCIATGNEFFVSHINQALFHTDDKAQNILSDIEEVYIREFSNGDRSKGMSELRVPPLDKRDSKFNNPSFIIGFCSSAVVILLIVIILKCRNSPPDDWIDIFRMFRGQFIISIFVIFISFNIYTWRHCGVNHVLIFEINPRHHIGFTETFAVGIIFVLIVFICGCGYVFHKEINIPIVAFPITSFVTIAILVLNPIDIFYKSSRFFFLKSFFNCMVAGLVYVRFADFWLGDQMTSLVGAFKDLHFMACSVLLQNHDKRCTPSNLGTIYVVASVPFYIRGVQCLRRYITTQDNVHLANMIKYFTCVFVQVLAAIYNIYVVNRKYYFMVFIPKFLSTTYLTIWDIGVDWSLIVYSTHKRKFKWRRKRIYKNNGVYIAACVFDVFVRYLWVFVALGPRPSPTLSLIIESIIIFLDSFRRFIWNFFRVENEHLNNIGKYRTVRDISIKPLVKQNLNSLE